MPEANTINIFGENPSVLSGLSVNSHTDSKNVTKSQVHINLGLEDDGRQPYERTPAWISIGGELEYFVDLDLITPGKKYIVTLTEVED